MGEQVLEQAMGIISHAGEGRSLAMEALASRRAGEHADAISKLGESAAAIARAHDIHLRLLAESAATTDVPINFLLAHAADSLAAATTCHDLAREMMFLYAEVRHEEL